MNPPRPQSCCRDGYVMNNANAPINAHAWAAHRKLAWLATAIGRPKAEANGYVLYIVHSSMSKKGSIYVTVAWLFLRREFLLCNEHLTHEHTATLPQ